MGYIYESQIKQALAYLADQWSEHPGSSEDPETCRTHAAALRALLEELESLPAPDRWLPETQIRALVHRARERGYADAGAPDISEGGTR